MRQRESFRITTRPTDPPLSKALSSVYTQDELALICGIEETQEALAPEQDKLTQYLESALARLARDILSIPATGAGVERLFYTARDICHYRRGSLKPETIRDLMMFVCTSKFDIEDDQRMLINEYLSHQEKQAAKEEKDIKENNFDPISDDEEDPASILSQPPVQLLSEKALGKRRRSDTSEPDEDENNDDDAEVPLPDTQHRVSGRVRKRSKRLDGYELGPV
ncbi:uncharacterized protein N7458_003714 [Penicillium daleae]|uniref:HAT C-terminal dimerisation domain-containing protein n=1 Tax=Penicillium daleae TaxID=63821 RepID=A0AAD6CAW6_9EURO|nr:uncharacterized protein N7458_003714 [Penicillium daleae]KAJ5456131.1 hypothetical protein N7458_003714 [Penicillium daleae]